jgi:hypothetical protein
LIRVGKKTEFLKLLCQILLKLKFLVAWLIRGLMRLAKALGEVDRVFNSLILLFSKDPLIGGYEERDRRSRGVGERLSGEEVERVEVDVEHSNERVGDSLVE